MAARNKTEELWLGPHVLEKSHQPPSSSEEPGLEVIGPRLLSGPTIVCFGGAYFPLRPDSFGYRIRSAPKYWEMPCPELQQSLRSCITCLLAVRCMNMWSIRLLMRFQTTHSKGTLCRTATNCSCTQRLQGLSVRQNGLPTAYGGSGNAAILLHLMSLSSRLPLSRQTTRP